MTALSGGSVERAKAAKVSIITLIHKSCTAENGACPRMNEPIAIISKQERLTVI